MPWPCLQSTAAPPASAGTKLATVVASAWQSAKAFEEVAAAVAAVPAPVEMGAAAALIRRGAPITTKEAKSKLVAGIQIWVRWHEATEEWHVATIVESYEERGRHWDGWMRLKFGGNIVVAGCVCSRCCRCEFCGGT